MQLKSLVERAHQSRGKDVVEAVQRQPWGPGEQHHEDHQIGRGPLATQQGISTCDSIGRDLLDAPGRYMPPRAWRQKQNDTLKGKTRGFLASWQVGPIMFSCWFVVGQVGHLERNPHCHRIEPFKIAGELHTGNSVESRRRVFSMGGSGILSGQIYYESSTWFKATLGGIPVSFSPSFFGDLGEANPTCKVNPNL